MLRTAPPPSFLGRITAFTLVLGLLGGCSADLLPGAGGDGGEPVAPLQGAEPLFRDLASFSGFPDSPTTWASSEFWDHWGDGRAELSGYRVTVPRYGEPREGELSLIYVTEPHDRRTWIKDDDVAEPHRVEVLKLIQSKQFLTGIYPYSVMTSVFSPVHGFREERFDPVRVNLSVQEWCGNVDHRVWPGEDGLRSLRLSYFATEGESLREVDLPEGTLYEDALLLQLRELDGPFAGGGDWEGWLVPELWRLRAGHGPVEPVRARIARTEAEVDGRPVTRFELEAGEYRRTYDVERAAPRRVVAWETSTGERAELLSTERLAYWSLNREGDEENRARLGLHPQGTLPPDQGVPCAPDGGA